MMTPECKKQEQKQWEGAGEKKTEGCDVSGGGEAGQRPGEWSGNGPKQHAIMSFFFSPPSLTHHTIRHCLFSDWEMQGHQKAAKRISEPLEAQTHTEGMSATPKYMLQFTTRGWKEENLDRVDLKKKKNLKLK